MVGAEVLKAAAAKHRDAAEALDVWQRIAKGADWKHIQHVRAVFPHADAAGRCTVFNIKGNRYRLIVEIVYRSGTIYVKRVLTHAEYSKEAWKHECAAD